MQTRAAIRSLALVFLTGVVLAPGVAPAQDLAGITGTAVDETQAALPGVVVEARSPALIEQFRSAFTDGAGNYRFIALPPGTYSVTFTRPGFRTVVREGIVLTGAFVAPVDAAMTVGQVQETVTVTGAAPLVDVVNTQQQVVMTADEINTLPAASSLMTSMQYVPGVQGNQFTSNQEGVSVRGSDRADSQTYVDGIESGMQLGGRNIYLGGIGLVTDEAQIAEIVYDTSSQGAEYAQSGLRANMIPKAGGNVFSGDVFLNAGHQRFISDNQTQEEKDLGFAFAPQAWSRSVNPSLGGPIARDRVWFFASYVNNLSKNYVLDSFFDPNEPSTPEDLRQACATPDACSQEELRTFNHSDSSVQNGRITWQMNPTHKLTTNFTMHQNNFDRVIGTDFGRVAPEALFGGNANPTYLSTTRWSWAAFEPAAGRSDRLVPALRPRVHRFRGERHRAGRVPGSRNRPPIGHQHPAELPLRGPPPQRSGVGLLRDRVAQFQGRPRRPEQRAVRPVAEQRGHLRGLDDLRGSQCRAGHGQRGSGRRTEDELRLRPLRAGLLDRRSLHPQPGGALRLVQ